MAMKSIKRMNSSNSIKTKSSLKLNNSSSKIQIVSFEKTQQNFKPMHNPNYQI